MLLFLAVLSALADNNQCGSPETLNLPVNARTVALPASMPEVTYHLDGETLKGQGRFYTVTVKEDTLVNINTCNAKTKIPVDILIFSE